jgi:hypothetical protein
VAGELDPLPLDLRELRNEQHLYNEKAGPYAKLTPDEAHRVLAERVGALASAEHSKWVTANRERSRRPPASEAAPATPRHSGADRNPSNT